MLDKINNFVTLSVEIRILSTKIEAKYPREVPIASAATVSHTSNENCPQSIVISLFPMVLSTATPVEAANGHMKLHSSVRNSAKVTDLIHSRESSMLKAVPARLVSKPTPSVLVDDKCKKPEEIDFAKCISCSNLALSKVIMQNAGEDEQTVALISPHDLFTCSQTKAPWSHIDLSLAGPIQRISYPSGFIYNVLKGHTPKSATVATTINGLHSWHTQNDCVQEYHSVLFCLI
ncbi:hypothetical protein ACTXT7_006017 [Hymenolepis weldensis]